MDSADKLTQGCQCPACKDIIQIYNFDDGVKWDKMDMRDKFLLFERHQQYTNPDYGMSDTQIIMRDIKKLLKLVESNANQKV